LDESVVQHELEARGLQPFYDRVIEQLSSLDQKAQAMVGLEGLLLALIAVFSSNISSNSIAVRTATWVTTVLLLSSALSSLLVLRIRWGTSTIANSKNLDEGLINFRKWRDHKLKLHNTALTLLASGLLGLVVVLTLILL
jgi:Zn-dependent membrane protease YugP